ncbi:unnamed protein product [Urochloa humidicola]
MLIFMELWADTGEELAQAIVNGDCAIERTDSGNEVRNRKSVANTKGRSEWRDWRGQEMMAPSKRGRRNNRQQKATRMSAAAGNRRPVRFAPSKFGRFAVAGRHARRKIVKDSGTRRKRGRAGLTSGRRRNEGIRHDARVLDANMLCALRHNEGVVHKEDRVITGRLGEAAVHEYFVDKLGAGSVKWMNEENESGLPYDITIRKGDVTEYVEVKATFIPNKNWFHITHRELQFAAEKGDSLTVAYVLLSNPGKANIVLLKNLHKLQRRKDLKLALVMSMRCEELVGECMEQISVALKPD